MPVEPALTRPGRIGALWVRAVLRIREGHIVALALLPMDAIETEAIESSTSTPGEPTPPWLEEAFAAVFSNAPPSAALRARLAPAGTDFQQAVWRALTDLSPGGHHDYAELARRVGRPGAVRAVANACGANPIAVLIPCHRITRRDGGLGGYRWGTAIKEALLARERADGSQG